MGQVKLKTVTKVHKADIESVLVPVSGENQATIQFLGE